MKTKLLAMVAVLCSTTLSFSQNKPKFKGTIYVSEQKQVFVHDSLPVYFFMSAENDPKNAVRLESSSKYANPMEFDGHGKHFLRHKDKEYEHEVLFEVYADGISPVTSVDYGNTTVYKKEGIVYTGKNTKFSLASKDEYSGLKKIYLSKNKVDYAAYAGEVSLSQEKQHFMQYFAVDNVGNVEKTRELKVQVDLSSPVSKMEVKGDNHNSVLSVRSTISLSSEDKLSGLKKIKYKFDDGTFRTYSSKLNMWSLSEGEHTLHYFATDNVNNDETVKTFKFFLDKSAPVVSDEILGDKFKNGSKEYASGSSKYKLIATDNKAGVKDIYYSINGGEYKKYEGPIEFPKNLRNVYLKAYATDNVSNKSTSKNPSSGMTRYLDLKGPSVSHTIKSPKFKNRDTLFVNSTSEIKLSSYDAESGNAKIEYKVNGVSKGEFTKAFTLPKEGLVKVEYVGHDNVNNTTDKSFEVFVDNTAPVITTNFSIAPMGSITIASNTSSVYPDHVGLFLSATDGHAGLGKIYYTLNGGTEKLYSGMITGFAKGQTYKMSIRSVDKLGNESTSKLVFSIFDKDLAEK